MVEENKTDEKQYSRQIATFGLETMGKLVKMRVLIVGLRGLGVEVAKNLILAGPKSVTLYDPNLVNWGDLSSNFYCKEEHVGKQTRANASYDKLQELNPYVKVDVSDSLSLEDHAAYSVVCYTDIFTNIDDITNINDFCRSKGVGFVLSQTFGPSGYAFVDYGNDFSIFDADGEDT